jgi:hypothetical protein
MNQKHFGSQRFFFSVKAFYRVNRLSWANERHYSIVFQTFIFALSKQSTPVCTLLLISNEKWLIPFHHFRARNLIALGSLFSFFNDENMLNQTSKQVNFIISCLPLDKCSIENFCWNDTLNSFQCFYFSSEHFFIFSKILSQIFKFTIYFKNEQFYFNSDYSSCKSIFLLNWNAKNPQ